MGTCGFSRVTPTPQSTPPHVASRRGWGKGGPLRPSPGRACGPCKPARGGAPRPSPPPARLASRERPALTRGLLPPFEGPPRAKTQWRWFRCLPAALLGAGVPRPGQEERRGSGARAGGVCVCVWGGYRALEPPRGDAGGRWREEAGRGARPGGGDLPPSASLVTGLSIATACARLCVCARSRPGARAVGFPAPPQPRVWVGVAELLRTRVGKSLQEPGPA